LAYVTGFFGANQITIPDVESEVQAKMRVREQILAGERCSGFQSKMGLSPGPRGFKTLSADSTFGLARAKASGRLLA
jgi:hypothetical protein